MDEKIIEGNKLIAEFMGAWWETKEQPNPYWENVPTIVAYPRDKDLRYHTSWDWLMPVVEKIEFMNQETGYMGVFLLYGLGRTKIECYKNEMLIHAIDILGEGYGITPTYKAVVEFINWYKKIMETKKYIIVGENGDQIKFSTDNLRHWLINHIDQSVNYEVFEFKFNTKKK